MFQHDWTFDGFSFLSVAPFQFRCCMRSIHQNGLSKTQPLQFHLTWLISHNHPNRSNNCLRHLMFVYRPNDWIRPNGSRRLQSMHRSHFVWKINGFVINISRNSNLKYQNDILFIYIDAIRHHCITKAVMISTWRAHETALLLMSLISKTLQVIPFAGTAVQFNGRHWMEFFHCLFTQ